MHLPNLGVAWGGWTLSYQFSFIFFDRNLNLYLAPLSLNSLLRCTLELRTR